MASDLYQSIFPAGPLNQGAGRASLVVICDDDPKALQRSHSAHHYQLRLTRGAAGKIVVGDYAGDCRPNSLLLLGPDLACAWSGPASTDDEAAVQGWLLCFSQSWVQRMIQVMPELNSLTGLLSRASQGLQFTGQALAHAQQLVPALVVASGAERVLLFLQLLGNLAQTDEYQSLTAQGYVPAQGYASLAGAKSRARIQSVLCFLSQHYDQDLSLDRVASRHGMSAGYLSRLFKQATGRGFCDFLTDLRISRACELLTGSERPITEICFDSGFKNISNFNRRFVALKQTTPTEFRRAR